MDWHFILCVEEDGTVYRICPSENPAERSPRFHRNPASDQQEDPEVEEEEQTAKRENSQKLKEFGASKETMALGD